MCTNLSAKYYQENIERLQKIARETYQCLSKEEKRKKRQYDHDLSKNYQKMKGKRLLSIEKNIIK